MAERGGTGADDGTAAARRGMVETIEHEIGLYGDGLGVRSLDPDVRDALLRVPRERFVPPSERSRAYTDRPRPIGHGQTISQPLIVALMTQQLRPGPASRVLDVGTGSGYQTAVLAELAGEVVTVEIVAPLAASARRALEELDYRNVVFRTGDARTAAADLAPFDGILVAAAATDVPPALLEQLAPGGRMVIPVGRRREHQDLLLLEKDQDGRVRRQSLFPVSFVPLTE